MYNLKIENIISDIKNGKLERDIDEKGAQGFWDLAIQTVNEFLIVDENDDYIELVEYLYNQYWEVYELNKGVK